MPKERAAGEVNQMGEIDRQLGIMMENGENVRLAEYNNEDIQISTY